MRLQGRPEDATLQGRPEDVTLQGRPEDVTLQGRPEDVTLQGGTFHVADAPDEIFHAAYAPDRNRISEFRHLPNFQLPHVHGPMYAYGHEIAQRSFFGPSGGKSRAAHPFSILPKSSFEVFCLQVSKPRGASAGIAKRNHYFPYSADFQSL